MLLSNSATSAFIGWHPGFLTAMYSVMSLLSDAHRILYIPGLQYAPHDKVSPCSAYLPQLQGIARQPAYKVMRQDIWHANQPF